MRSAKFDPHVLTDPSWWHWAATVPLLAGHLAGLPGCLAAAIVLCGAMAIYFWTHVRGIRPMPVQVRLVYLAMLLLGTLPGMSWLHWVQLVGTTAMIVFGYCPLVRMLTLLPWNRTDPIQLEWLVRLITSPAAGGLFNFAETAAASPACSCACSVQVRPSKSERGSPKPLHLS
jgi:hypothetical protein